jgi:hypothetical protein
MNAKILTLAIAMLSLGIAATTATLSNMVYAKKPNDPDLFGDSASDLAQSDPNMGDHSKDGGAAGDHPYDSDEKKGRSGIGNIGNDLGITCGSKHPSDLANILNGGTCEEP